MVFAWDDYGQSLDAQQGQPDVLAQYHPLPLVRFAERRQTECTVTEPCDAGEGDCDTNADCVPGLVCSIGAGPKHLWAPNVDVCVAPHCNNAVYVPLQWPSLAFDRQRRIKEAMDEHRKLCPGAPQSEARVCRIDYPRG